MSVATLAWISIALLLPSLTAWGAEICHSPRRRSFGASGPEFRFSSTTTVVQRDVITKDVEKVDEEKAGGEGFNTYVHPFGEVREETTTTLFIASGPPITHVSRRAYPPGFMFEDCCTCGDNEKAAYQLKIFSKHQDPTRGQKFDKPILVTQGFDANYGTAKQFRFGEFELKLSDVFDENTGQRTSDVGLLRVLYDEGYDIALLLWKNPLIDIRTNAKVTLQALRWLESYTDIREGTEPVVIGPSMGGLVTRYALQEAGGTFPASGIRARLFIAFDSPNRGAEVPMSLQAITVFTRNDSVNLRQTFLNLTSRAARQLLLSSVDDQNRGLIPQVILNYEDPNDPGNLTARDHAEFMGEINDPDFRAQMQKIVHQFMGKEEQIYMAALINGSGTGRNLDYPEGCRYASIEVLTEGFLRLAMAKPGNLQEVFFGDTFSSGDEFHYRFQEPAFVENAPGGLRDTYQAVIDEVQKQFGALLEVAQCFKNARSTGNHAFIPSLSGAGLPKETVDINRNQSWFSGIGTHCDLTHLSGCPLGRGMFDEFRAPASNQEHVSVTRENKRWFRELICTRGPQPVVSLGETLISTGVDLELEVLTGQADFTSEIRLVLPSGTFPLATSKEVGRVVRLEPVPAGVELLFEIVVRETGETFRTGPAYRNPDSLAHATVVAPCSNTWTVGFEDLAGGGDFDFDDVVFQIRPRTREGTGPA
jgi:Domain of unknown function (DUF4114)